MRPNIEPAACPPGKAFWGKAIIRNDPDYHPYEESGILLRQPDVIHTPWGLKLDEDQAKHGSWILFTPDESFLGIDDADVDIRWSLINARDLHPSDLPSPKRMREAFDAVMATKPANRTPAFKAIRQLILDTINGAEITIDPAWGRGQWEGRAIEAEDINDVLRRRVAFLERELEGAEANAVDAAQSHEEAERTVRRQRERIEVLENYARELLSQTNQKDAQ